MSEDQNDEGQTSAILIFEQILQILNGAIDELLLPDNYTKRSAPIGYVLLTNFWQKILFSWNFNEDIFRFSQQLVNLLIKNYPKLT